MATLVGATIPAGTTIPAVETKSAVLNTEAGNNTVSTQENAPSGLSALMTKVSDFFKGIFTAISTFFTVTIPSCFGFTAKAETPAAAPETQAAAPETPAAAPETPAAAPETPAEANKTDQTTETSKKGLRGSTHFPFLKV